MSILFILLAILLLGILIMVHEYGHFISARMCGIPVKEFSIGFGPKLVSWKSKKHDTLFKISAIPLGGYCMYYGELASDGDNKNDEERVSPDDPRYYYGHNVWKRIFTVIAGPLMNIIFAFVVAVVFMFAYGSKVEGLNIAQIQPNSPAEIAGFEIGDKLISINGESLDTGEADAVTKLISKVAEPDTALDFVVVREGEELNIACTPKYLESESRFVIGVNVGIIRSRSAADVFPEAWKYCVDSSKLIASALGKLFTTGEGFESTSGPVGVIQQVSQLTQIGGLAALLNLAIIISINLGLVNLLPIPGLDGARLIFMLIEALRGKPVNQKVEAYIHTAGYILLFGLMIFLTFRDVIKLFR